MTFTVVTIEEMKVGSEIYYIIGNIVKQEHLHITFAPAFSMSSSKLASFHSGLLLLSKKFPAFSMKPGAKDTFTIKDGGQVDVLRMSDYTGSAHRLHSQLSTLISAHGARYEIPQFTGENFSPHISLNNGHAGSKDFRISWLRISQYDKVKNRATYSSDKFLLQG